VVEEYVFDDVEVVVECEVLVDDFDVEFGCVFGVVDVDFVIFEEVFF